MTKKRPPDRKSKSDAGSPAKHRIDPAANPLTPWQLIQHYDDKTWETFIEEWSEGFDPPYHQVVPLGGPGDKGRDLAAYVTDPTTPNAVWDSYQCKHYKSLLAPTDVYAELGKLCFYTHLGDYTVPRKYYFVSPLGVGTKLHDMLKRPDVMRAELLAHWDSHCRTNIQSRPVELTKELRAYIDSFDFSIFWFLTPKQILIQHERTRYWHRRFPLERPPRPPATLPPDQLAAHEMPYVSRLLAAYADHTKRECKSPADLRQLPVLMQHFKRSRGYFYFAESLARFSRDHFAQGAFDTVKNHVFDGVADITCQDHDDGFRCVLAVTEAAAQLPLPEGDLQPYVGPADKKGICHHLANDGSLTWVPE